MTLVLIFVETKGKSQAIVSLGFWFQVDIIFSEVLKIWEQNTLTIVFMIKCQVLFLRIISLVDQSISSRSYDLSFDKIVNSCKRDILCFINLELEYLESLFLKNSSLHNIFFYFDYRWVHRKMYLILNLCLVGHNFNQNCWSLLLIFSWEGREDNIFEAEVCCFRISWDNWIYYFYLFRISFIDFLLAPW